MRKNNITFAGSLTLISGVVMRNRSLLLAFALFGVQPAFGYICSSVNENQIAKLTCPSGQVVSAITFASYGTPGGGCPNYTVSTCNSSTSMSVVKSACLGKASCQVTASNTVFGDPCSGTLKGIEIAATCGAAPSPSPSPSPSSSVGARDPLEQPFASNSIWNMPIGSGAIYKPAGLSGTPGYPASNYIWAKMPGADEEYIFMDPTAPVTPVYYSSAAWTGANRCTYSSTQLVSSVPMPSSFIVPNNTMNNGAAFLLSDHRTIAQIQPLARCTAGGYATSLLAFPNVDIYGDGRRGGHGGSGLSSIGGSIRMGELRPGQQGPRHALKINVYAAEDLYNCSVQSDCFRWPAFNADSGAVNRYGTLTNNMNSDMKMGALLAIPASVNINNLGLETAPGKQLAWTLQNYGAYIVDDQGVPGYAISTEKGPAGSKVDEFQSDYGFAFVQVVNNQATSPWVRDLQRLVKALNVVSNNSATSIGGGGTPLQPLAPAIAP